MEKTDEAHCLITQDTVAHGKAMRQATRDECPEKMRCRYRRYTGKPAKGKLLDEFCEVCGHERKYASKPLSWSVWDEGGTWISRCDCGAHRRWLCAV